MGTVGAHLEKFLEVFFLGFKLGGLVKGVKGMAKSPVGKLAMGAVGLGAVAGIAGVAMARKRKKGASARKTENRLKDKQMRLREIELDKKIAQAQYGGKT